MRRLSSFLLILGLLFATQAYAAPLELKDVPEPLKPWVQWVLDGYEEKQCPFLYNQSDQYRCRWPSGLDLELTEKGGSFNQQWQVMVKGWVPLPGAQDQWPQDVKINNGPALV
ncbi:MAG: hypothetical protein GTO40_07610 [Deltaproteobacteria bacterium]|nr:hypothetical protein [Deltaproteobacteria bacterium]